MYLDDVYWGWHKDGESLDTFRKFFRHARFKKGSTTTVQNSYQPTAGEVQLAQASADYAKKVAPNAYFLNDVARSLLQDSLGTVQVDFNGMNNTAQRNLGQALGAMQGLAQKNDAVTRAANGQLGSIAGRTGQLAERNAGLLGSLIGGYNASTQAANADLGGAQNSMWDSMNRANGVLGQTGNTVGRAADAANSQLGWAGRTGLDAASRANADIGGARGSMWDSMNRANGVLGQVGNTVGQAADAANGHLGWAGRTGLDAATQANGVLVQAGNTIGQAADAANGQLGWAGRASLGASNAANGLLGSLANGVLPTAYQQNMEGSIRSALTNTIGKTIDSLGQRGVLNSSVTTGAMNDIERNASDTVARQYQQNISQVAGLAQQQNQNATAAARDWANYAQQQNANTANAANARANYAQQQNANTMAAAQNWANMAQQQNQNTANAANAQANYAQQQNANTTSAARDWANMAQQQNQNTTAAAQNWANMAQQQNANTANAAGMQAQMAQQQNANTTNAAQQWANLAQQRNANQFQLANALQNLYNTQYSQLQGALGQQANLAQQQWSNAQGNNSQNSGLYSNLANMAGSPIALAAAAQEAAQTPAFNAWNASMGLNGATTNALAGIAGKGTSTQTTHQSGGGGFFGGLLGGVLGGAGNALGAGLFCFPTGTKIEMADGTEKRIEHIEVGDKVMAWGENGEEEAEVLRTMQPHHVEVYNLVCSDAHTMATLSQPFLTEDGAWVTLEDLKMKQRLKNAGEVHAVSFSGDRWVYDLQVSGANTYIADGFIAKGGDGSIWKE